MTNKRLVLVIMQPKMFADQIDPCLPDNIILDLA